MLASAPKPAAPPADTLRPEDFRERALLAARQGTTTFLGFWRRDDAKPIRAGLAEKVREDLVAECKRLAQEADTKGAPTEEDPFSGAADDSPTPDDLARAEREAREAQAERDRQEGATA